MRVDVTRLDVSGRRRSLIGYAAGMAAYTLVVVALYPTFKHSTSLDNLVTNDPTAAALFGVSGPLSSSGGWLSGNIYANFFPLVMLMLTIGYGAASLAGQDEDGTLRLIATLPIRRTIILLEKVGAMALQAILLSATVGACVVIGRSFDLNVTIANVCAVSLSVFLLGLDFGIIAMAIGALSARRGTAIGIVTALAATSYLISSLASTVSWIHTARYLSLFYWAIGHNQITTGVSLADAAVLTAVGIIVSYAAAAAFRRLDLH